MYGIELIPEKFTHCRCTFYKFNSEINNDSEGAGEILSFRGPE
jgi:hypothetical protein